MKPYDEPWFPTLQDLLHRRQAGDDYWNVGLDFVEIDSDYSNLVNRMDYLVQMFNVRYATRKISEETPTRWMIRLQATTDGIANRYDALYQYYYNQFTEVMESYGLTDSQTRKEILEFADRKDTTTNDLKNTYSQSQTATGDDYNLPDSYKTTYSGYASDHSIDSGSSNGSDTSTGTVEKQKSGTETRTTTLERRRTDYEASEAFDRIWRNRKNLDREFVNEYQNCFLNVFWYR